MPKFTGNKRISPLKRLNNPYSITNLNNRPLMGSKISSINDARQLLVNRNKTSFDARQLLNRQVSKTDDNSGKMVVITGLKDMKMKDGRLISTPTIGNTQLEKKKKIFAAGPSTFVTIRNSFDTTKINSVNFSDELSLTKTIKNASVHCEDDDYNSQTTNTLSSTANQKVVISFVNDKYEKNPTPTLSSTKTSITNSSSSSSSIHYHDPPPVIKHLHDASIQTISSSSSSRSPIRTNSHRRQNNTYVDERNDSVERTIGDDLYEPPVKRTTSSTRKTTTDKEQQVQSTVTSTGSTKRTSTGAPVSSRTMASSVSTVSKESSTTTQSNSTSGTILVTNLQSSVSEDDVIELFGQVGRITEIKTLSQGCIQITYAKREYSEQAVTKYHNRLLDGQFMYVSLQQPTPQISSKPKSSIQQSTKDNGTSANSSSSTTNQPLKFNTSSINNTSNKYPIDPVFFRQALFQPSNNSTNPVQFQVKL